MPEQIPNGFFCRDLIVFNHLRRGGFVSKGFIFEAPDLTNSPVADLNDFQDQLCLLLASLHEHQRLQVQYFCDSDYKGELLRYQQETDKFTDVWTKRARNERFSRYWQAMSERKLELLLDGFLRRIGDPLVCRSIHFDATRLNTTVGDRRNQAGLENWN